MIHPTSSKLLFEFNLIRGIEFPKAGAVIISAAAFSSPYLAEQSQTASWSSKEPLNLSRQPCSLSPLSIYSELTPQVRFQSTEQDMKKSHTGNAQHREESAGNVSKIKEMRMAL